MNNLCACGCGQTPKPTRRYVYGHFLTMRNKIVIRRREEHPGWKGGKRAHCDGYVEVRINGDYMFEHVHIAETALGRKLPPQAEVHHANGIRSDNSRGNLVICESLPYHRLLHVRIKAYQATGNPNNRKCSFCQQWDETGNMKQVGNSSSHYHRACSAGYAARRKERKLA